MTSTTEQEVAAWYEATWPSLYRFVYRYVQNREEAQDLTQDTYVRCLDRLRARGRGFPPPWAYVRAVALNQIRDRWRRRSRTGRLTPLEDWLLAEPAAITVNADPDEATERLWLQALFDRLPPDYRQVLDLRLVQGYSRQETAQRSGRARAAVPRPAGAARIDERSDGGGDGRCPAVMSGWSGSMR